MNTKTPTIHARGVGERLEIQGNVLQIKASAAQTDGAMSAVEYDASAGFPGPPLHVHAFDEWFYVLEGGLTFRLGDDIHELETGGCVYVPGTVPHTFANDTCERVRFLVMCTPGGFETYFRALAAGDSDAAAAAALQHGMRTVGAPIRT